MRRVAGASFNLYRQSHLGDWRFEIARHVHRERFQRRDIERVQGPRATLRQLRKFDHAGQKPRQGLAAAGWRNQQHRLFPSGMSDERSLMRTNAPAALREPVFEGRRKLSFGFLPRSYGGG